MTTIPSLGSRASRLFTLLALAASGFTGCDGGASQDLEGSAQAIVLPTTTLTVNTVDDVDDGACNATHCSLREAITAANAITTVPGSPLPTLRQVVIAFNLPGTPRLDCPLPSFPNPPKCTLRTIYAPIQISQDLPPITRAVAIDGTTQTGYAGAPLVELRGPGGSRGVGLYLLSNDGGGLGGSVIRGLAITGFSLAGVMIDSAQNFVAANYLGLEPSGAARGNRQGIILRGDGNHVGDTAAADRNVISGNTESGVVVCRGCLAIRSGNAADNHIDGNFIGTTVGGNAARGNQDGITVIGDGFQGGASGVYIGPARTVIGGSDVTHRNVISGNRGRGVVLQNGALSTRVGANWIGPDATGAKLGNGTVGVEIDEADGTVLGTLVDSGATVNAGNVISGNASDGVRLSNFTATPHTTTTKLFDNLIGLDPTGNTDMGNGGSGLSVTRPVVGTVQIGVAGHGNKIAFNLGQGVTSAPQSLAVLNVRSNSIFSNGQLGIDQFGDGVTTNQLPTVLHATKTGATTKVDGLFDFHGFFNRTFELDVFASPTCDGSGFGEGKTFLGTVPVTTSATVANGSFSVANLPTVNTNDAITVTATQIVSGALARTTEFSACVFVTGS